MISSSEVITDISPNQNLAIGKKNNTDCGMKSISDSNDNLTNSTAFSASEFSITDGESNVSSENFQPKNIFNDSKNNFLHNNQELAPLGNKLSKLED